MLASFVRSFLNDGNNRLVPRFLRLFNILRCLVGPQLDLATRKKQCEDIFVAASYGCAYVAVADRSMLR